MSHQYSGGTLANLVAQKQKRVAASLALGITPPPLPAPAATSATTAMPIEDPMLTHVRQFLASLGNTNGPA
jgi:hypothetical protein